MSTDARIESLRKLAEGEASPPENVPVPPGTPPKPLFSQRLTGIDLIGNLALVGDGVRFVSAPLTAKEIKAISKIGHQAYRRAMSEHLDSVEAAVGAKRKGKKRGRPKGSKNASATPTNGEAPRKRGRPKKNRTVTYEPPSAPAPEAS